VGVRARGGSAHTGRGAVSFLTEVLSRARGAGASGPLTLRADSGFYSTKVVGACTRARVAYSITAEMSEGPAQGHRRHRRDCQVGWPKYALGTARAGPDRLFGLQPTRSLGRPLRSPAVPVDKP